MSIKAERKTISVAGSEIEVFMMPDGSYRYSLTSLAATVGAGRQDIHNAMRNNRMRAFLPPQSVVLNSASETASNPDSVRGLTCSQGCWVADMVSVGNARVSAVGQSVAVAYWAWKASNGSKEAVALLGALAMEALDRRSCAAFGTPEKSAAEYEASAVVFRQHLVDQRVQANIDYQVESDRICALAEAVETAEEYDRTIQPLWDALRDRKRSIEGIRLSIEEYEAYRATESQRR